MGCVSLAVLSQVSTGRARLETAFLQSNVHLKDLQELTSRLKRMSMDGPDRFQASVCGLSAHDPQLQWNLSTVDTIGTQLAILYRTMFLIQR